MEELSGIQLITKEREEQLEKHQRSILEDVRYNRFSQLSEAAAKLILVSIAHEAKAPSGWDTNYWEYVMSKPYKQRLIIAGALIAAEIDRLNYNKAS